MGKTPFKMKYKGSSFPFKSSPAKHPEEPHTEHHELMGTINDAGTRVIDETGNWVGTGDRPDLAPKKEIEKQIEIGKKAPKVT